MTCTILGSITSSTRSEKGVEQIIKADRCRGGLVPPFCREVKTSSYVFEGNLFSQQSIL
jgi:hypothetical protein